MANFFSSNLKYLREKKGLSKNKLGELTGVNQSTIGRWENKERSPTIDNVIELLNALHIPLENLGIFLGADLTKNNSLINDETVSLKDVPEDKKKIVMAVIEAAKDEEKD